MVRRENAARAGLSGRGATGTTLLELLVTSTILMILAGAALPIAANSVRREKEIELRRALRDIRVALDSYHRFCLQSSRSTTGTAAPSAPATNRQTLAVIEMKIIDDPGSPPTCYPKSLDVLVEGVELKGPSRVKLRFLRRIPKDPFNRNDDEHDEHGWRLRSTTDKADDNATWNRRNVFDVRSASEYQSLNYSYYKDW